jgi:acyl carrier protein
VVVDRVATTLDLVRAAIGERLPGYLVPSRWQELDALPLNANGKVDRGALPADTVPAARTSGRDASPLEQQLVELWQAALGVDPVHVDDDFFELGGHSLRAVELFAAIEQTIGVQLPLVTIFEAPTVAQLAERIQTVPPVVDPSPPARRRLLGGRDRR